MKRLSTLVPLLIILSARPVHSQTAPEPEKVGLQPSPEMQRLLNAFAGSWTVSETFEVSASREGKARQGTASFRACPGFSLIEEYKSNGSAGELRFLAVLWWDDVAKIYRILTCANNDGCQARGSAKWEGDTLVNSWEEEVNGKTAALKDSFVDISPASFRLVSEGSAQGKTIWRVTTKYIHVNSVSGLPTDSQATPRPGCAPSDKVSTERFQLVMQTVAEGWNHGDARLAASCFAENAIYSRPPSHAHLGRKALYEFFGGVKGRELPMHMTWHNLVFDPVQQIGVGEYTFQYRTQTHGLVLVKLSNGLILNWREYEVESKLPWDQFIGDNRF